MNLCVDSDMLVSVSSALGWEAEERIAHLASCERCRKQLRLLGYVHSAMEEEVPVSREFLAGVVGAIEAEAAGPDPALPRVRPGTWHWRRAARVLPLASLAGYLLLVYAIQAGATLRAPAPLDVAAALVFGLVAAGWVSWRERGGARGSSREPALG